MKLQSLILKALKGLLGSMDSILQPREGLILSEEGRGLNTRKDIQRATTIGEIEDNDGLCWGQ